MKRFFGILGWVIAVLAVAVSVYLERREDRMANRMFIANILQEYSLEALQHQLLIEKIDRGEIAEAREMLNLRLDAEIMALDSMIQGPPDNEVYAWAINLLARIGRHRAAHQRGVAEGEGPYPSVNQTISTILTRAMEQAPQLPGGSGGSQGAAGGQAQAAAE